MTDWQSKVTSYTYDSSGRLTSTTLGNGLISDRTYDAADRLTNLVNRNGGTTISSYAYTLDKVGNRTQVVDTSGTSTYSYDAAYQLTGVTYPNADTQAYTYDAMGNRTQKTHNGTPTTYTYDAADQMTAAGGVTYTYDSNGNQTGRGSDTFGWDHENRMTSSTISGTSGTNAYNGDGLRTSRTIGGNAVSYRWDVGGALPVILQDSGSNTYVYGLDLVSRTDSGGTQEYFLTDALGSTTALANGSGTVSDTYTYDVFGSVGTHAGSSQNEFAFTGQQLDPTGLQFLRSRYYDLSSGRFMSRDLVPLMQRYAYVGNDPVNYIDPHGLLGLKDIGKAAKKVGGAVKKAAKATMDFAERFATLNCLDAAIGLAGVASSVIVPGSSIVSGSAKTWIRFALHESDNAAFVFSTAVNLHQVNKKEGASFDNIVNYGGAGASAAAFHATLYGHAFKSIASISPYVEAFATGVSIGQCAMDVWEG